MSNSAALSTSSSSSWRSVLAPVWTTSESMQGVLCSDGLLMLHRSKWRCLASTYSAEIQDLIELVKPNFEYEWCNNLAAPLQALQQAVQEGEASMQAYIPRISDGNCHSWLVDKALKLGMSTDVVDVHLHDFLWASSIVREQVFSITGSLKDQEAHLLEQARKLHEIWLQEDADADLRAAKSFLDQLKGEYSDNKETCQLVDFIFGKLSHIKEAAHNPFTSSNIGSNSRSLPLYMCIDTDQCLTDKEGIFRNDQTEVHKVMWLGGRFVLKTFKLIKECEDFFEGENYWKALFNREAAIQARVWHPHVVPLVCCTSKPPGLLMELLQEDLADLIKRRRQGRSSKNSENESPFPLLMAVELMLQIAKGMEYLHSTRCIIHRDLKPANILVSSPHVNSSNHAGTSVIPQMHLKIADFGVSKAKLDCSVYTTRDQGTTHWMAPEVYGESGDSDKYSNKADVYSFGIVCSEILTGKPPFIVERLSLIRKKVLQGDRPPLPQHCPHVLSSFIQMCWHADPTERPTFIQICRMLRYFKACLLLADCDNEAPYICTAHIDHMIDRSLTGRTFQPKALTIPLEMYFYGIHFRSPSPSVQAKASSRLLSTPKQRTVTPEETNGEVKTNGEEKSSNLESENQVLRQQTPTMSPATGLSNRFKSIVLQEELDLDALLQCVTQDVGFSRDRPVAACIIYKSLLQWRAFEAESTNVFGRIIQTIGTTIESQENNDILAYWLTNTSMLLFLLQSTLKASGAGGLPRQRQTLFGRMTQGFRSSLASGEANSPALLFKVQLTACVQKIYEMIRDNLKKEIAPLLAQASRISRVSGSRRRTTSVHATPQQIICNQFHSIIESLSNLLDTMLANHVSAFFVRKVFTQIFSFINVQLFNSLLLRRECCSFSNGEDLKAGLAELEHWAPEYAGSAWDELKHIRQAVRFLVIREKHTKSLDELTHDLCPVLSIQQFYRISTMYWDDKYGTHSVSPEVIASMRVLMTEDSNPPSNNSFLLSDDESIPFSVDDISASMAATDLSDVDPPPVLRENPSFYFLQP